MSRSKVASKPEKRRQAAPQPQPSAPAKPSSGWIISPVWDSLLFIGAPIVCMATLLPLRSYFSSQELSVLMLAFFTFGHHLPGFMRAYGDKELFDCYRLRFLLAPPLIFAVALWFDIRDLHGLLIFISAWDIWHVLMQHYGFMRIYDAKQGEFGRATTWMDWAVSISWYLTLIVTSPHYRHDLLRRAYSAGLPVIPVEVFQFLQTALFAISAAATLAYAGYHLNRWRSGRRVNWRKITTLGIFLGATYYLYVYVEDFLVGFGVWSAFHCLQYYGIVWVFNQNRVTKSREVMSSFVRFLFRPSVTLGVLYVGLILAYGSVNYLAGFISNEGFRQVMMAFTFTSTALHYYYDGFIWKVRQPHTRKYLDIPADTAPEKGPGRARATLARGMHQLWPANRGWLQAAYLSVIVLVLGSIEIWRPPAELAMRQSLVALAPNAGEAHFNLASVYWKQGQLEEAEKEFREAVRLMPQSAEARNNLGAVLDEQGRTEEAVEQYRAALAIQGGKTPVSSGSPILPTAEAAPRADYFAAHSNLASALAKLNRLEGALIHFEQALRINPYSAKVRTNFGAALSALGRYDEALAEFDNALRIDPAYPGAHVNIGSILAFRGETERAREHLRAAMQGDDERARQAAALAIRDLETGR